jgi:hypothetical protein
VVARRQATRGRARDCDERCGVVEGEARLMICRSINNQPSPINNESLITDHNSQMAD